MEDLREIFDIYERFSADITSTQEEFLQQLEGIVNGLPGNNQAVPLKDTTNLSPQREKKRVKRLTALDENDENNTSTKTHRTRNSRLTEIVAGENEKYNSMERSSRSPARNVRKGDENETRSKSVNTSIKSEKELMPPPLPPVMVNSSVSEQSYSSRPKRAAKLDCEKHLKEPSRKEKLRRPTTENLTNVKIKLEHEQRASQMHEATVPPDSFGKLSINNTKSANSMASSDSQHSIIVLPKKEASIISVSSEIDSTTTTTGDETTKNNQDIPKIKMLKVRVKREKMGNSFEQTKSSSGTELPEQLKKTQSTTVEADSVASTAEVSQVNTTQKQKRVRKKKVVLPIKVERFSDTDEDKSDMSVASRTRQKDKNLKENRKQLSKENEKSSSMYEEAVENLPEPMAQPEMIEEKKSDSTKANNETININKEIVINSTIILGAAPNDATYCTASQATFILEDVHNTRNVQNAAIDATFNVLNEDDTESENLSMQSMETAREIPYTNNNSLITEDETFIDLETPTPIEQNIQPQASMASKILTKSNVSNSAKVLPLPTKACQMHTRTIEIFNPLVQSPVKKKVEAYENVAAAQATSAETIKFTRSKQAKEKGLATVQSSSSTPTIGKLPGATLKKFLTPNQTSNTMSNSAAQNKKVSASASKVQTLAKANSAGNMRGLCSSAKAISRENSAEDFRKGLHQMAEERKKQREQKHLQAAQLREAKERERAERMAKLAKEREEKRLKKQKEAEQRKRELEEMRKKLRVQEENAAEEIAKHKAKILMEQEKNLLQQMKPQVAGAKPKSRMPPTQPQTENKYSFEMLQEDDSTDDENKTSYKRPPPPTWSRSHVRGPSTHMQQVMPTAVVDSFFSVEPMTPDLTKIFPTIDPRYLKRNSSVFWATPPRYSQLPKY